MTEPADYSVSLDAWRQKRIAGLKAADGWLNIVGRWWLEEGTVRVGSAADNDIVVPAGPAKLGTLTQDAAGVVTFIPANGSAPVRAEPNKKSPPKFELEGLLVEITTMNGENALRIRDTHSTEAEKFAPIDYFPPRPELRVVADWVPFAAPQQMTINTSKDIETEVEATHKAVFDLDGRHFELIATHGTPESPPNDLTNAQNCYYGRSYPACDPGGYGGGGGGYGGCFAEPEGSTVYLMPICYTQTRRPAASLHSRP